MGPRCGNIRVWLPWSRPCLAVASGLVADEQALGDILEKAFAAMLGTARPKNCLPKLRTASSRIGSLPPAAGRRAPIDRQSDAGAWVEPMRLGGLLLVGLFILGVGLLALRRRATGGMLVTLQAKLLLAGLGGIAVIIVTSTAVATSLALQHSGRLEQHRVLLSTAWTRPISGRTRRSPWHCSKSRWRAESGAGAGGARAAADGRTVCRRCFVHRAARCVG